VEVVGRDLRPPTRSLDGHGVDLKKLLRIDGTIVLLHDTWLKLGGPVNPSQVRNEGLAPDLIGSNVVVAGLAAPPLVSLRRGDRGGMILLGLPAPLTCTLEGSLASSLALFSSRRERKSRDPLVRHQPGVDCCDGGRESPTEGISKDSAGALSP
jgi:hypothetical protein